MAKVAVLGSGVVGTVLADGFLKYGETVVRGSRDAAKLADWLASAGPKASTATFQDAARQADIVVLAVKGSAAEEAVKLCGNALDGKVVIDATNPIAEAPPVNGVLRFFTGPNESLLERLQAIAPAAKFVKAFSCVGNSYMIDPKLPGGPPTMFICGNDESARAAVTAILDRFGWETADMGLAEAARAIEPLCILWCLPGFTKGQWTHAFKLLKA
jgi:predicted dinucleotide-binding enzyme